MISEALAAKRAPKRFGAPQNTVNVRFCSFPAFPISIFNQHALAAPVLLS
jgi:hypothetical protein